MRRRIPDSPVAAYVSTLGSTASTGRDSPIRTSTLSGDPDGDGIANGVENIFGTDPNNFSQGLVAGEKNGNQFTFTHPLNASPGRRSDASLPMVRRLGELP